MLKIMVVDDERLVRMGLKELINEVEGFEVVSQATDGLNAIEEIRIHQPDVVITDIKMPKMDGKELIKYLNANYPSIRKIVLSGFEDFNFVHEAMKNGAVDYLLKPVDEKELIALLKKIEADIRAEEEQKINNLNLKIKLNESFPFLRDRFVHELVSGKYSSTSEIEKKLDYFNLRVDSGYYCVIIVSINNYGLICRNEGAEEAKLVSFVFRNIAEESTVKYANFFSCVDEADLIVSVAIPKGDEGEKEKIINDISSEIYNNLVKYAKRDFALCVGKPVNSLLELKQSYDSALGALKYRFYSKCPTVIRYSDIENSPLEKANKEVFYNFIEKYENFFDNCIKTGNAGRLKMLLKEFCSTLRNARVYPPEAVKMFFELYARLQSTVPEFKKAVDEIYGEDYSYIKAIELFDTLDDVEIYTDTLYYQVVGKIASIMRRKDKKLVEIAKEYVDKHYNENITLSKMASITYVNPNYFCGVFKNQTGENFVDYLTRVRIEKAKVLLKDIRIKTYEVGRMVGYENPDYFSKVFKKMVGITPSEYRNLNL